MESEIAACRFAHMARAAGVLRVVMVFATWSLSDDGRIARQTLTL